MPKSFFLLACRISVIKILLLRSEAKKGILDVYLKGRKKAFQLSMSLLACKYPQKDLMTDGI